MTQDIAKRPSKNTKTTAKKEVILEHPAWVTMSEGTITGFYSTRTEARSSGLGSPKRALVRVL